MKAQVKMIYQNFVRSGHFLEGRKVLRFLRQKELLCGLSDIDWTVSSALEKAGIKYHTTKGGNFQRFYLKDRHERRAYVFEDGRFAHFSTLVPDFSIVECLELNIFEPHSDIINVYREFIEI